MAKSTYVVLNDGDTFSSLDGCLLVIIDEDKLSPEQIESLENGQMKDLLSDWPDNIDVHDLPDMLRPILVN